MTRALFKCVNVKQCDESVSDLKCDLTKHTIRIRDSLEITRQNNINTEVVINTLKSDIQVLKEKMDMIQQQLSKLNI